VGILFAGFFVYSLCSVSSDSNDIAEDIYNNIKKNKPEEKGDIP
jgi:hypothetical protein